MLVDVGHKQQRMSYHGGSSEDMEASDRTSRRMEPGSRAFSTSTIHLTAQPTSLRPQQPPRPKGYPSDDNVFDPVLDKEGSPKGVRAPRPNSLEGSRSLSNSSSPLTLKGSSGFLPARSDSMSSEDLVPTRESGASSRGGYAGRSASTMMAPASKAEPPSNRNSVVSTNQSEKRPPSRTRIRRRSGSPGSEMVTLEEFLEESNHLSPPTDGSGGRDDLLGDYFKRTGDAADAGNAPGQAGYRDPRMIPVNYTSQSAARDGKAVKPGQLVKPNLQPTEAAANSVKWLPPSQPPIAVSRQTPEPQHPGTLNTRGASLSRAFSLATADLLKANGPDVNRIERPEAVTPVGKDFTSHVLRTSTPTGTPRERPQSARMSSLPREDELRSRSLDTRRISMASPNQDWTLPPAPSSGCLQQHHSATLPAGRGAPRAASRFGEVAMVSPLRPIPSIPEAEGQTTNATPKPPSSDCPPPPASEEEANKGGSTKSTPASPDPNADPQTVWYEYGCV